MSASGQPASGGSLFSAFSTNSTDSKRRSYSQSPEDQSFDGPPALEPSSSRSSKGGHHGHKQGGHSHAHSHADGQPCKHHALKSQSPNPNPLLVLTPQLRSFFWSHLIGLLTLGLLIRHGWIYFLRTDGPIALYGSPSFVLTWVVLGLVISGVLPLGSLIVLKQGSSANRGSFRMTLVPIALHVVLQSASEVVLSQILFPTMGPLTSLVFTCTRAVMLFNAWKRLGRSTLRRSGPSMYSAVLCCVVLRVLVLVGRSSR